MGESRCRSPIFRVWRGDFDMSYLICDKRKGSPKVHIEVCKRKCKVIHECKAYKEFVNNLERKAA